MTTNNENTMDEPIEQILVLSEKSLEKCDNIIATSQDNINNIKNEFINIMNAPAITTAMFDAHAPAPTPAPTPAPAPAQATTPNVDNTDNKTVERILEASDINLKKCDKVIDTAYENLNRIKSEFTKLN